MSLDKALEDLKFDKRLTELNLRLGRITQEQIDKNLQSLEDLQGQVENLELDKADSDIE